MSIITTIPKPIMKIILKNCDIVSLSRLTETCKSLNKKVKKIFLKRLELFLQQNTNITPLLTNFKAEPLTILTIIPQKSLHSVSDCAIDRKSRVSIRPSKSDSYLHQTNGALLRRTVSVEGLRFFKKVVVLTIMNVINVKDVLNQAKHLPNLIKLSIQNSKIDESAFPIFQEFRGLKGLTISDAHFSNIEELLRLNLDFLTLNCKVDSIPSNINSNVTVNDPDAVFSDPFDYDSPLVRSPSRNDREEQPEDSNPLFPYGVEAEQLKKRINLLMFMRKEE